MQNKLRIFSTFTGIGGFEQGIINALGEENIKVVGFSEILKPSIAVYKYHYPKHINYGDITKLKIKQLPDFDLLVGGFPCQSFSFAGKRKGFEDARGTMFFELAKILKEKRPHNFLFENVKGLLYHDNGKTFKTILITLDALGYDVQWCVFNSKLFGVPQNRNRVYIVGYLRGQSTPVMFDSFKELSTIDEENKTRVCSSTLLATRPRPDKSCGIDIIQTASTLTAEGAGHWAKCGSNVIQNEEEYRVLSPIECERLQGMPDDWTKFGIAQKGDLIPTGEFKINSVGQNAPHMVFAKEETEYELLNKDRYYLCGNAVSVPVVSYIIKHLYK